MILVTGGAGYIGSHTVKELLRRGYPVVVLDNLSTGHRELVLCEQFIQGDLADSCLVERTFARHPICAVIHFAAHTSVPESVADPQKYYRNNVAGTLNLLQAMLAHGVKAIIFSSSAAVYGDPVALPIPEDHPTQPKNPYGRTKLVVEEILADYARAYGLRYIALRYFNAAGSDPEGEIGELHDPETHLIPIVLEAAAGKRPHLEIYGTDYPTKDGTAVRDYIHVSDLARAHVLALERMMEGGAGGAYNLGIGRGYTVREVVETCRRVTGRKIPAVEAPRRPGDPAALVADPSRARRELGWEPKFTDLEAIVETAWAWMQRARRR
ncbi:MAG: UDP-glucose 4-epimerase GalE [Candidatus Acetothermia bacterium]|jgi:UDP-glucose 4-epimerase|nr:UDP-glucose 4-epimerase GalE [Candidatus Acetothermia bacterium]